MNKTHYEKLGVSKDATADELKRAYREKATRLHPDKGGDAKEFAEVARAYEILNDPARRLLYDATGADERKPLEVEVQTILMEGFSRALASEQDIEVTAFTRNGLKVRQKGFPAEVKKIKAAKKKLEAKRKTIKSNGPTNLAHMIIDTELQRLDASLIMVEHEKEVVQACLEALDEYEEDWPRRSRQSDSRWLIRC